MSSDCVLTWEMVKFPYYQADRAVETGTAHKWSPSELFSSGRSELVSRFSCVYHHGNIVKVHHELSAGNPKWSPDESRLIACIKEEKKMVSQDSHV